MNIPLSSGTGNRDGNDPAAEGPLRWAPEAVQANKVEILGRMAGGIIHDLNNILGAMMMQVNLLESDPSLPSGTTLQLQELGELTERAAGVTRQLLTFSRRQNIEMQLVNMNVVLERAYMMISRMIGEDISFERKFASAPLWIEADSGMVEQVLMNFCINARDAMPSGGRLTIESHLEESTASSPRPGRFACLSVTDTGVGMDAITRQNIFQPFFTTKSAGKGTGLGLATVDGILKLHRGWVDVQSEPGCGSTFRAFFPIKEPKAVAVAPAKLPGARGAGESILVIEDDSVIRGMMVTMLRRAGYRVAEASSATEAIRLWYETQNSYDLLITDFLLPGGRDGTQLAAQFLKDKSTLKVIVMSGYSSTPTGGSIALPEHVVWLPKPFRTRELLDVVRQCVEARAAKG